MTGKKNILIIALTVFLMGVGLPGVSLAVDVFAECAYTDVDVECYIYVNTGIDELRSGGVKLIYATDQFDANPTATKNTDTNNPDAWYFGDPLGTTYDYPNSPDTSTDGEAVVIVGKMDTRTGPPTDHTGDGVSGERALMGTVKLVRSIGSLPANFGLDLALGVDDGVVPPNEGYVNFVNTAGDDLDVGVTFNTILAERGDANLINGITSADMFTIRSLLGTGAYSVFADCNGINGITSADMFCVRSKL